MSLIPLHANDDREKAVVANLYRSLFATREVDDTAKEVLDALAMTGLDLRDDRLRATFQNTRELGANELLTEEGFAEMVSSDELSLVQRALTGGLAIPDFETFKAQITELFEECRRDHDGRVASYIPQLARVNPEMYALGLCTVDGQRMSLGDDEERYCVQSTCKPVNYAVALDLLGREKVHQHVGREPSGRSFNELTLNGEGLPHNPMINSGAIMCSSLINPDAQLADRFDFIMQKWRDLSGGRSASFDNTVYLSEKETADRNFALAYFMRENGAFPPNTDVIETLDFYFQCCSVTVDVRQMSMIAATFANGGVCPTTNRRVFKTETVKDCLSHMYSCGMYDSSGEFAFTVGIPAKSGVSGALMLVVPGVCGLAIWSPRLDKHGNSVRGVRFAERLVETFAFHTYANMVDSHSLIDPTVTEVVRLSDASSYLCAAAARGDLSELRRLIAGGANVSLCDYDGRTALHLAASEGQEGAVRLLIKAGCALTPTDRWGNTPLDDAKREGRENIVNLLTTQLKCSTAIAKAG
ncbi:MAG: glutaminase A [Amphiplicatus sp.]